MRKIAVEIVRSKDGCYGVTISGVRVTESGSTASWDVVSWWEVDPELVSDAIAQAKVHLSHDGET